MGEYWGATADPNYGYSPYSGQEHYAAHPVSQVPFTAPPGPGNPLTVEVVAAKIRNMHPEQMAALADQWQNARSFLEGIRHSVVQQSTVLQDEQWRSPAARDAFLRRGPGEVLTYLDVWIDAVQRNITALRHLVGISLEARREVDGLVQRYEQEMREAGAVGFTENLGAFLTRGVSWNAAAREEIEADRAEVVERYRHEAQVLALKYGDQYFDYIAVVAGGAGPPVQPVNAVLSTPVPSLPASPGPQFVTSPVAHEPGSNAPGAVPPGVVPPGALPPGTAPPGTLPPGKVPPGTVPPGTPPPGIVPPGSAPPGAVPPGSLPPGSGAPGTLPPGTAPPGTLPPGTLPPGQALPQPGTIPPGTAAPPGTLPPGALPPGTPPNGVPFLPPAARPPVPGQISRFGRGSGASAPPAGSAPPPGRSLRRPTGKAAAPVAGGRASAGTPAAGGRASGKAGEAGVRATGREIRRAGETEVQAGGREIRRAGADVPPSQSGRGSLRGRARGGDHRKRSKATGAGTGFDPPTESARSPVPKKLPPAERKELPAPAWADWFSGREEARPGVIDAPRRTQPEPDPESLRSPAVSPPPTGKDEPISDFEARAPGKPAVSRGES
ncbi:hypothetical protein AB0M02_46240 [Actinoplanes sp. NPDC051861]|uniref:hypothetical protein n=1 Tax=Actinoplanes sp. NPDC051861 TaxID=3155170 RepID=UPI00341A70EF